MSISRHNFKGCTYHDIKNEIVQDKKLFSIAGMIAKKYGISVTAAIEELAKSFSFSKAEKMTF